MMKTLKLLTLLTMATGCFANSLGQDANSFAFPLYEKIEKPGANLVYSPFSLFSNLSLLYFAAKGDTAEEISSVLHMGDSKMGFLETMNSFLTGISKETKNGYTFTFANGLFAKEGTQFQEEFTSVAKKIYQANVESVNFKRPATAAKTINDWVAKETRGEIQNMIQSGDIDASTYLVIANTVYFEGKWQSPFNERKKVSAPFHLSSGEELAVNMLQQNQYFPYFETDDLQGVLLPFAREGASQPKLSALILLPKKGVSVDALTPALAQNFSKNLSEATPTYMQVQIPEFCFSHRLTLNDPLIGLGMEKAFTREADFSKLSEEKNLFLSKVLQETFFSFNARGVTATSATTSHIGVTTGAPREEPTTPFIADHPFLFFIIDTHTDTVLFMGKLEIPETKACNAT